MREKEKKETVQADADGPRVVNHCVAGRRVDSIAKKKLKAYQSVADRRDETDWYYPLYTRGDLRASQYIKFIRLLFFFYISIAQTTELTFSIHRPSGYWR